MESNKASAERMNALVSYKTQLEMMKWSGAKALEFLIKKGEALEQWQEQLSRLDELGGPTLDESMSLEETLKIRDAHLKGVVEANNSMNGELRGIFKNGQEVRGLFPKGWGSLAHVKVDKANGEIVDAERIATPADKMFAVHYIWYLEKEFAKMNGEDDGQESEMKRKTDSSVALDEPEFKVIDDHFQKLFFDPENKGMIEIIDKRLNMTKEYDGDLAGESILDFIRGKKAGEKAPSLSPQGAGKPDVALEKIILEKEADLRMKLQVK